MTRNEVVKIVSQKLRTTLSTMSVEYREELNLELGLLTAVQLNAWLLEVEDDADAVFIVISYQAIMSVRPVRYHVGYQRTLRDFCFLNYWSTYLYSFVLRQLWSHGVVQALFKFRSSWHRG